MYYNYHAKIKKMIEKGELEKYEVVEDYNGISPALVLFFKNHRPMPVRIYRFEEYFAIFEKRRKK